MFGAVVMVPDDSNSILASPGAPRFSKMIMPDDLIIAERGEPAAVAPPPTTIAPSTTTPPAPPVDDFAAEVIRLTNVERVAAGLPEFAANDGLSIAAATHAMDQRNVPCDIEYLSHTGSDGSNAADRILRAGLSISRWAENVACAHPSAASVVRAWMKSPGHRANILNPKLTHMGAAVSESDTGQKYWVQVFGTLR
jgi:uncharacterized protein YkwD